MAEGKQSSSSSGSSGSSGSGSGRQQQSSASGKGQSSGTSQGKDREQDSTAPVSEESEGVTRDPSGVLVPEGNAPGPSYEDDPQISAIDLRPRIEPRDRATYLGAVHKRDDDVDVPDEFQMFGESDGERDAEVVELDAKGVEVFQVIGTNHQIVFRFDDQTVVLSAEQSRAFVTDLQGVLTNVVT